MTDGPVTHDGVTDGAIDYETVFPAAAMHLHSHYEPISPPRQAGSPYITPEGEQALRAELHALWKIERPEVTKAVSAAAANGDRSENGDYIYGKKRLREIDSRVRFLRKRLDALTVVSEPLGDRNKVWFGAWVTVESEVGEAERWRIVGPDEFDVTQKNILRLTTWKSVTRQAYR